VVGAAGAVGGGGAAELGGDEDGGLGPRGAEAVAQRGEHRVERLQPVRHARRLRAVRVPAFALEHGDARAVGPRQEARREAAEIGRALARRRRRHRARVHRRRPQGVELRVVGIELLDALQEIVRRLA
jgi:hypothetical protein